MNTPKTYQPREVEDKWYSNWLDNKLFRSVPDEREPYTIVIPPPNVTGVLHMGHTLNSTVQDIMMRRARMQGYNACWVPGTDHASIATEAKVVKLLAEQGINKTDIGRDEFMKHAYAWKDKYGGIILDQFKKLGLSVDWDRLAFTMDEARYESVIQVFVDLYNKGLIYRGVRMVNWDPKAKTALSDEEVHYKDVEDKLYYVTYKVANSEDTLTVATTRPETIMGDTAICVNPNDERHKHLHGKKVLVPMIDREIPVILDDYVDMEFGTGCLKVTPAHDINDYKLGQKHGLEVIDVLNDDGSLSEAAQLFVGIDRFEARELAAERLKELGQLSKVEPLHHSVGTSERTGVVIEPKLSMQWFCNMKELAKPATDHVLDDTIRFVPSKLKNTYRHWMENIHEWTISRQLWWGQRIPAYYLPNREIVVAKTADEALELAQQKFPELNLTAGDLKQEEDVLDTWFSSWLWPISVFDGIRNPDNEEINYYYPTQLVVTGPDIIFFWIARMAMAGYEYKNDKPFDAVYFTGMVRDEQGRKMSKQLGNSPDLLKLIEKYGADGTRFGILISSPAGNDLLFDTKLCDQGSNFANKLWNAFKLIESWQGFDKIKDAVEESQLERDALAISLFKAKLSQVISESEKSYKDFRVSEALQSVYRLIWNDFCSNYLEWIKPTKQTFIAKSTYETTLDLFEEVLKLLHPMMPFITEELFHLLRERKPKESICIEAYPKAGDTALAVGYERLVKLLSDARNFRNGLGISFKEPMEVELITKDATFYDQFGSLIKHIANFSNISQVKEKPAGFQSFLSGTDELFDLSHKPDTSEESLAKVRDEIKRLKGFLIGIEKKLANERFVSNAPEAVIATERKKEADTKSKIEALEAKLN